jgi:VWFA-related protein
MICSRRIARLSLLVILLGTVADRSRVACQQSPATEKPQQPSITPKQQQEVDEGDIVRVSTTLVTVPVSVMDHKNHYLTDLRQEQFHVFENGTEQQVALFASVDRPFMVGLVLDISDSTQAQLKLIQEAAIAFIDQLKPNDKVFVIAFDSRVRLLAQPEMNRDELRAAIRALVSGHGTSLYAVVQTTINQFPRSISGRKALVLLTDGIDTTSPVTMADFQSSVRRAEESDIMIYPVQINAPAELNPSDPGEAALKSHFPGTAAAPIVAASYARAQNYLHQLAAKTGSEFYAATDLKKLTQVFARVAEDLRKQYSLGYYPKTKPHPGEIREIKVTVDQPQVTVHAKTSYVCCGTAVPVFGEKP